MYGAPGYGAPGYGAPAPGGYAPAPGMGGYAAAPGMGGYAAAPAPSMGGYGGAPAAGMGGGYAAAPGMGGAGGGGFNPYTASGYAPANPAAWALFQSVDTDRTGSINPKELQAALSHGGWVAFSPKTTRMLMRMYDTDRSGACCGGCYRWWRNYGRHHSCQHIPTTTTACRPLPPIQALQAPWGTWSLSACWPRWTSGASCLRRRTRTAAASWRWRR